MNFGLQWCWRTHLVFGWWDMSGFRKKFRNATKHLESLSGKISPRKEKNPADCQYLQNNSDKSHMGFPKSRLRKCIWIHKSICSSIFVLSRTDKQIMNMIARLDTRLLLLAKCQFCANVLRRCFCPKLYLCAMIFLSHRPLKGCFALIVILIHIPQIDIVSHK